jgi:hypothetical protein
MFQNKRPKAITKTLIKTIIPSKTPYLPNSNRKQHQDKAYQEF